ncbi:hypothetical protein [Planktotalea sp.]|uniref:hypothetical protein n=1 Tax=Planktotalea sp. TaxID=2029877 RepID=UPI00329A016C
MRVSSFILASFLSLSSLSGAQAQNAGIGPGDRSLSFEYTINLFVAVCVKPKLVLTKSVETLIANKFKAHPQTGTYYNNVSDVSFKLNQASGQKTCSMAFSSKEKAIELATALAISSANGGKVNIDPKTNRSQTKSSRNSYMTFTPVRRHNGRNYYRAVISTAK